MTSIEYPLQTIHRKVSLIVSDTEIFIPGFNIFRKDRNRHGGGIVVFVKDKLICTVIPFQHNNSHLPPIEFLPMC